MKLKLTQLFITTLIAFPFCADAAVILVTTRASQNANDLIDWGTLGSPLTDIPNPFGVFSSGGLPFIVSLPSGGPFTRRDENPAGGGLGGWSGNFAPGDHLIDHLGTDGPLTLTLMPPNGVIRGAGVQIEANQPGNFTATIIAFDVNGNSLGSFNVNGTSAFTADNSAIYIGVLSDTANIHAISFDTNTSSFGGDFAINRVSITVPEPSFSLLLLSGVPLLLRRRMLRTHDRNG